MSQTVSELIRTDAELDLIAFRELTRSPDPVLDALAVFAATLDDESMPPLELPLVPATIPCVTPMSRARKGGLAASATVALLLSSSGLAAAVTGDALAPLHYVARQVLALGPDGSGQLPGWDLEGSGRISTSQPAAVVARVQVVTRRPGRDDTGAGLGTSHGTTTSGGHGPTHHRSDPTSGGGSRDHGPASHKPTKVHSPPGRQPGESDPTTPIPTRPTGPRHGHHLAGASMTTPPGESGPSHPLAPGRTPAPVVTRAAPAPTAHQPNRAGR